MPLSAPAAGDDVLTRSSVRAGQRRKSASERCHAALHSTDDLVASTSYTVSAALHGPLHDLSEGLEAPVQLLYLLTLLGFLVVGAWLVVRQVLVRRELEEAAKVLGERTRQGGATSEVCTPTAAYGSSLRRPSCTDAKHMTLAGHSQSELVTDLDLTVLMTARQAGTCFEPLHYV